MTRHDPCESLGFHGTLTRKAFLGGNRHLINKNHFERRYLKNVKCRSNKINQVP